MNKRKVDNVVQAGVVVTGTLLCILIGWPLSPEGLNQPDHWWFKLINGLIGLILSTLLSGFLLCVLLRKWADFIRSCIILEGLLFCVLLSWPFSNEVIENPLILAFLNGFVGLAGFTVIGLLLRLAPPLVLKRVCVPLIVGAPLVWAFVTFVPFGPKTYQSPPDVFEAAQAASAKRDMEGVMNCLTEESQHTFVEKLVGFFGMMKGFAELADKALPEPIAKLDKVMKKHGISDKVLEEIEDGKYAVKDKAGLVGDFFKAMNVSKGEELPPLWSSLLQPSGRLEDISVNENTAVGTAVDGDTRIIIGFIKVRESWLIDLSASGAPAYQANWPDLNPPYEEWKKNPLSEEEIEQLQGILTSVDRFDGFDKASKKLLDRVAQLWMPESDEAFQFTKEDRGKDSPLLLGGEAYTGFTRLGTNFRRWKNGKEVYSVSYYLDSPAAHKIMEATYKEGDLISERYWNSKGDEVKSLQEATKIEQTDAVSVSPNFEHEIQGDAATITGCDKNVSGALIIPVTIENKPVTSIGERAFYNCSSLTSITIPDSVANIGGQAFAGCTSLTNITIGNRVTRIGDYAFHRCSSLTSITIPDGVTNIEGGAFYSCSSLTSITIPDSVTSIEGAAFLGCRRLTSITIPDSVTSIEGGAFRFCSRLTSVTFFGDAPKAAESVFSRATPTIYRNPEAKGWGDTFAGRPVKLISEKP